jgi:hypothetical protein
MNKNSSGPSKARSAVLDLFVHVWVNDAACSVLVPSEILYYPVVCLGVRNIEIEKIKIEIER